mmetsp:Transcript_50945/g.110524  ORF Transcript_50945/g.110524 Transcript_50945/m.110524 type:complete len:141 (+) Transcript_50945:166-588(+)
MGSASGSGQKQPFMAGNLPFGRALEATESAESAEAAAGPITTFMLGNLPCRITRKDIEATLDFMGFEGTYHVCRLPSSNKKNPKATNLGYAFISFVTPEHAATFLAGFGKFQFQGSCSAKKCTLRPAHLQGCVKSCPRCP